MRQSLSGAAILCAVVVAAACSNPQRDKLDRGMAFARRMFVEAGRNPIAAQALGSNAEMGGNLSTYLAANMPEHADLPMYQDDRPSGPWSIALRALGEDRVIIEGYGESLDHPLRADTVSVRFGPRR